MLAAGNAPNFRTIADFRKLHLATLAGLFEEVLKIALEAGALKLGRVALDGTKLKANASKHKAMSYGRMKEQERQLRAEVRELLAQAEATDAAEDAHYGADRRGDELPAELQRRESRLKKIRAAQRALEERARQQAEKAGKPRAEVQQAKPADKDQYNFIDPESRLMKGSDGLVQGYNAQAAVEPALQLIVGQSVTPAANDKQQIEPMVQVIEQQSGQPPSRLWPTVAIVRRKTWRIWRLPASRDTPSMPISRLASRSMTNTASRARTDRYPGMRRGSSA